MANGKSIHGPSSRALRVGDPTDDETRQDQWVERGTIIDVHPNSLTCDVISERHGRLVGLPLPGLSQDPQGSGGHIEIPRPGQGVILQRGLGLPHILSILPVSVSRTVDRSTCPAILGLGDGASSSNASPASYLGCLPVGLLPGDWLQLGNQGQFLGVFDQGAVGLYAGAWSHVIGSLEGDTLNVAGRNLNIRTGAGQLVFKDYGGKQSTLLQLGTDQKTETGVDKGNYPLTVRLGGESKGLLDLVIADRVGNSVYEHIIDASGKVTHEETGPSTNTYKQLVADTYGGDLGVEIQGSESRSVAGDRIDVVQGSLTQTVSQNALVQVMNDRNDNISRNWDVMVGRAMSLTVSGATPALPGAIAARWMVSNGSLIIDAGFPGTEVIPSAKSSIELSAYMPEGNIVLSTLAGKIIANSTLPDSVLLGATMGVAPIHAVKWELGLEIFLTQLIDWLKSHVHPTGVGPSGPSVMPMPPDGLLKPLLKAIPSLRVMYGA